METKSWCWLCSLFLVRLDAGPSLCSRQSYISIYRSDLSVCGVLPCLSQGSGWIPEVAGLGVGRAERQGAPAPRPQPPPSLHSQLVLQEPPMLRSSLPPPQPTFCLPLQAPASFPSLDRSSPVPFVGQRPLCGLPPLPFSRLAHTPWKGQASCLHCLVSCTVHRAFPICLQVTPPGVLSYIPHPHSTPFPFGLCPAPAAGRCCPLQLSLRAL